MRYLIGCSLAAALLLALGPSAGRADDKDDKDAALRGRPLTPKSTSRGLILKGRNCPGCSASYRITRRAIGRLDKAANDEKIAGVILRIHDPLDRLGEDETFRKGIARIQARGKKVHAWLADASNMDYVLASACDEVVMPEPGTLMLVGVRAKVSFYKKLFDLIGVKAEMLRVGEFKSAAEPYTRT